MDKAVYRRKCLLRNPTFWKCLVDFAALPDIFREAGAKVIRAEFGVDPNDATWRSDSLEHFLSRVDLPRYLLSPGGFRKYPGSLLRDSLIGIDRRGEMFEWAKIWIPVYPDTTQEDLNWPEIKALQARHYDKASRIHRSQFEKRLVAWDYLVDGMPGGFVGLQGKIRVPQRQARNILEQAWRDVTRTKYPGIKEALRQVSRVPDLQEHLKTCPQCKQWELCKIGNRLLDEDTGAFWKDAGVMPEITPEAVEVKKARQGRKRPAPSAE